MDSEMFKDKAFEMIDEASMEAFDIYKVILEDREYSESYLLELKNTNEKLKVKLLTALEMINTWIDDRLVLKNKKHSKKIISILALGVVNTAILFTSPTLGLFTSIIYSAYSISGTKGKQKFISDKAVEDMRDACKKAKDVLINISNNETFINKRLNELANKEGNETKSISKVENNVIRANELIQCYIDTGYLSNFIDEDTKNTMIGILKNDLDSDSDDLEHLLLLAKSKVEEDTFVKKMEYDNK